MAIKTSGDLSLKDDIAGEFGDAADHKMSEFYRFGKHVPGETVDPNLDGAWSNSQYRYTRRICWPRRRYRILFDREKTFWRSYGNHNKPQCANCWRNKL